MWITKGLSNGPVGELSDAIHACVQAVHAMQNKHFSKRDKCTPIRGAAIEKDCFCILISYLCNSPLDRGPYLKFMYDSG